MYRAKILPRQHNPDNPFLSLPPVPQGVRLPGHFLLGRIRDQKTNNSPHAFQFNKFPTRFGGAHPMSRIPAGISCKYFNPLP